LRLKWRKAGQEGLKIAQIYPLGQLDHRGLVFEENALERPDRREPVLLPLGSGF